MTRGELQATPQTEFPKLERTRRYIDRLSTTLDLGERT